MARVTLPPLTDFRTLEAVPVDHEWGLAAMRWPTAQQHAALGKGVTVAVLDSGVDYTHPFLAAAVSEHLSLVPGEDDAPAHNHLHATHVAGTIHRYAPEARIASVKVLGQDGSGDDAWIVRALALAKAKGWQVVNLSLGGPVDSPDLAQAVKAYVAAGGILVAAAGNDGPAPDDVSYPARYEEAVAVTAVDRDLAHAPFASTGPEVDVAAPGVDIISTLPGNRWGQLSGTSMATPHMAAAAAILLSASLPPARARDELLSAVQPLGPVDEYGHGFFRFDLVHWQAKTQPALVLSVRQEGAHFSVHVGGAFRSARAARARANKLAKLLAALGEEVKVVG